MSKPAGASGRQSCASCSRPSNWLKKPPRGATNLPRRRAEFVLQTTILLRYCQYRSEESAALLDRRVVTTAVFDGGAEHDARDAADASCAAPQGSGGGVRSPATIRAPCDWPAAAGSAISMDGNRTESTTVSPSASHEWTISGPKIT